MTAVAPVALAAGESIRLAEPGDIAKIIELANRATGMSRDAVLKQLVPMAEGVVLERNGELAGFSIMRRFGRGHAIGTVVAPDSERVKALIAHWSDAYAGSFVRVDVTATSGLGACLAKAGLVQVDAGVAMARNGVPVQDVHRRAICDSQSGALLNTLAIGSFSSCVLHGKDQPKTDAISKAVNDSFRRLSQPVYFVAPMDHHATTTKDIACPNARDLACYGALH